MSIFSHLRRSRQQAKEHNAKLAEQKKKDAQTTPYRHIPTHAASDAISSAPPAWREVNDRPRIVEQNRRRSAMAAAGYSMNMPSTTTISPMPRVSSGLSYVSYPNGEATPHVGMPRAYSSNSVHHPYGPSREVVYSMPDAVRSRPSSWKGKEVGRHSFSAYDISGGSSTAVSKDPTPEGSSRASNSSHDELEMVTMSSTHPKKSQTLQVPQAHPAQQTYHPVHPVHQVHQVQQLQTYHQVQHTQQAKQLQSAQQAQVQFDTQPPLTQTPQQIPPQPSLPATAAQQVQAPESPRPGSGYSHRLHPSYRRTSSEISDRTAVPVSTKPATRDARPPPPSMRGFTFIPTTPNQPPPAMTPRDSKLEASNAVRPNSSQQRSGYGGITPKASPTSAVAPPAARNSSDLNLGNFSIPSPSLDFTSAPTTPPSGGYATYQARVKEHYPSAPTAQLQQPEMEPIVSNTYARHSRSEMPPPLAHDNLVNIFPEPVPDSYDSKSSRGKLSKGKKTRWSFSKSSPITA
ncbi:hypothetical protein ARSEF4850_002542 [Beauveria asiatica]